VNRDNPLEGVEPHGMREWALDRQSVRVDRVAHGTKVSLGPGGGLSNT
jgi:hypothetical protein